MSYHELSATERVTIQIGLCNGFSQRRLARLMNRSPSTVSREIRRNRNAQGEYVAIMGNCGRVLRTNHGKFKGIIIDHAGNLLRNGKPTDELPDRLDMDDGDPIDRRKQDQQPEEKKDRACPKCKFMYSGLLCPKCGHEVMIKDGVAVANGKLVKLEDRKTVIGPNNKQKIFGELLQYARDKGKKDAWAQYAYQAFMGEPIKREFLAVEPVPTSPEISQWVKGYNVRCAKSPRRFA